MTDPIATQSADATPPLLGVQGKNAPQGAANAAAMQSTLDSNSKVSDMASLREQAPDVYRAMMEGIAMKICRSMQDHQRRLKEIMRKARSDAQR